MWRRLLAQRLEWGRRGPLAAETQVVSVTEAQDRMTKHRYRVLRRPIEQEGPMRTIVYSVAMSLDGYVAGPNGEADWIVMDPEFDFMSMMTKFDTILMGRRTFEATQAMGGGVSMPGYTTVMVSRDSRRTARPCRADRRVRLHITAPRVLVMSTLATVDRVSAMPAHASAPGEYEQRRTF